MAAGITETKQAVERAVGLDYAQFSRTVILAQNSFANFLKARHADKSALLEKLTGTDVYTDISKRIFNLAKEAGAEVDILVAQREATAQGQLPEAELRETNERITLLDTEIAHLEKAHPPPRRNHSLARTAQRRGGRTAQRHAII